MHGRVSVGNRLITLRIKIPMASLMFTFILFSFVLNYWRERVQNQTDRPVCPVDLGKDVGEMGRYVREWGCM